MKNLFTLLLLTVSGFINAQIANIPAGNFKTILLSANSNNSIAGLSNGLSVKIDTNNDGQIQISEALLIYRLNFGSSAAGNLNGIEFFTNLETLYCQNNQLTSLDLTGLSNLKYLDCSYNQLSTLNLTMLPNLEILGCSDNDLTSINFSGLNNLNNINCSYNNLQTIDISNVANLKVLSCSQNQISSLDLSNVSLAALYIQNNLFTSIDLSGQVNLIQFWCSTNQITNVDVSAAPLLTMLICNNNLITNININGLSKITDFECMNNQLTTLDLSNLPLLNGFWCNNNNLTYLNIKNGSNEQNLNFPDNPNLQYICADESQIANVQSKITQYGYTNCNLNTYCSFSPGGNFYTIQGNSKLDSNNNGCDPTDYAYNNLKFSINNGTTTGFLVPDFSGAYKIDVPAGSYTVAPILVNPNYYNVSPASAIVTFPASNNPTIQDFCITPNGAHQDIEISILPITVARPGFNATYKLTYRNKGNVTVSGTVNLNFNDAATDFVSANPVINYQNSGTLYWTYANLQPFEKREIIVVINLNSPQENPALNSGDDLYFETAIEPFTNDENNGDNLQEMKQTVVNSFDPNDKTCIEGDQIAPAKVGSYVHYLIRFENTGTFPAENIVVKDMIDSSKFDINSLIPTDGSHQFVTKIDGNKVEFIFENINLPFDDANNDGYVAFKIKTKSTLVLGNTFSNSANIYFDYNFPIITNTATTTVAVPLANNDFVFNDYLKIYPNPAKNVLTIDNLKNINISSISIYTILGQVIQTTTNPTKTIDVSELKSGNYFLKINSDKGSSFERFIKD